MATALVVTQPFADFDKGDRITDPEAVQAILKDHHHRVIKIAVEDEVHKPAPAPAPQASAA